MLFGETSAQLNPVPVHLFGTLPDKTAELARVGREHRFILFPPQEVHVALEGIYPVCVYHEVLIQLPVEPSTKAIVFRPADAWAHEHHVPVCREALTAS